MRLIILLSVEGMLMSPITNPNFTLVKDSVKADDRGRLTLGEVGKGRSYRVSTNSSGQILLDPVVNVPERELWLWQNDEARESVRRGTSQAAEGKGRSLGSFA